MPKIPRPRGLIHGQPLQLKVDYVDLYLIHQPKFHNNLAAVWKSVEDTQVRGLAKSIGVSNFSLDQLKLLEGSKIIPAVNQVRILFIIIASVYLYVSAHAVSCSLESTIDQARSV